RSDQAPARDRLRRGQRPPPGRLPQRHRHGAGVRAARLARGARATHAARGPEGASREPLVTVMAPRRRRRLAGLAAFLLAGALSLPPAADAQQAASCAPTRGVPGGDWPTYGHDYSNTRYQGLEKVISPADAPFLATSWSFS